MTVTKTQRAEIPTFGEMARKFARDVGKRIRQRRDELGLSQSQVAQRMPKPVEAQRVSKWERGENMPSDENLEALSVALEVEVAFFYVDEPEPGTPDLMASLAPNGNGPAADEAGRIVSLLERQNVLLEAMAESLAALVQLALEAPQPEAEQPTATPSRERRAAGP